MTSDQQKIKAVLFDLGDTLIDFGKIDKKTIFQESAKRSHQYLENAGQPVEKLMRYFKNIMRELRLRVLFSNLFSNDFDSLTVMKNFGRKKGFNLSEDQWKHLNWIWYQPLAEKAVVEQDLGQTLKHLQDKGLKLGIVSNTFVSEFSLDRHLAQENLLDYFPMRIYSYQLKKRKPSPSIFRQAAQRIQTPPANILFIGDRIDKDVKGAKRAGMTPVLKRAYTNKGKKIPRGTIVIENISELPAIVDRINSNHS